MLALAKQYNEYYTITNWKLWKDNWELINGFPYCMSPAPIRKHQDINGNIYSELKTKLKFSKTCKPYLPIDWIIDEDTVVQPDVLVVCKEFTTNQLHFPPTIIFEILSPSTAKKDKIVKYDLYEQQGVKYYTIVNPDDNTFELFLLVNCKYQKQNVDTNYTFETDECLVNFDFTSIW